MNHDALGKIGIDVGHDAASSTDGSLRNPGGDRPVTERRATGFDTIVEQTVRLWEAAFGFVLRFNGKIIRKNGLVWTIGGDPQQHNCYRSYYRFRVRPLGYYRTAGSDALWPRISLDHACRPAERARDCQTYY